MTMMSEIVPVVTLEENEEIIGRGMASFIEVGQALLRVRDDMQYVQAGFDTFDAYCKERWGWRTSYANQTIASSRVALLVQDVTNDRDRGPTSEFTVRPLTKVLNNEGPDAVIEYWGKVVERHVGDKAITAAEVNKVVNPPVSRSKPGWFELLGQVGDDIAKMQKDLEKAAKAIDRKPNKDFRAKAGKYADQMEGLVKVLRGIETDE